MGQYVKSAEMKENDQRSDQNYRSDDHGPGRRKIIGGRDGQRRVQRRQVPGQNRRAAEDGDEIIDRA